MNMVRLWTLVGGMWLAALSLQALPLEGTHWLVPTQALYTLEARGSGPATLTVVDRASGVLATLSLREDAKTWKGRTSLLLEPGDYQLRWKKEPGVTTSLEAIDYRPVNAPSAAEAPVLAERSTVRGTLLDQQSMVWQVQVPEGATRLSLAIRGRNVGQAVLWREGVWDNGLSFSSTVLQTEPGRPYRFLEIDQDVLPGRYLLQIFGGPRVVWGNDVNLDPFIVIRDGEFLPEGAVRDVYLDGEGRAEWLLGPTVELVQVEAAAGSLVLSAGARRHESYQRATLGTRDPVRIVSLEVARGTRWAVVQGAPGTRLRVRALPRPISETSSVGNRSGETLVVSSASAFSADGYPSTAIAVSTSNRTGLGAPNILWEQSLSLSPETPLHLATNNGKASSFLVRVKTKGSYSLVENRSGGSAEYRFELFDDRLARNGTKPLVVRHDGSVELQAKLYWVTSSPLKGGRTDWALVPSGLTQGLTASGLWNKPTATSRESWAVVLPSVPSDQSFVLFVPEREGVPRTVSVRSLPVAAQALPVLSLEPGQVLEASIITKPSTVSGWLGPNLSIDRKTVEPGAVLDEGTKLLRVESPRGGKMEWLVLPQTLLPEPDAPPLLVPEKTLWNDWAVDQTRMFELKVSKPGLYRLETLGRLSLSVRVRTPLRSELFSAQKNAGGTNARLYAFLNPGVYRVETRALDRTAGRAGLSLTLDQNPVVRTLVPGTQARASVPADRLLRVDVTVPRAATYLLTSTGLNQSFVRRFEDPEGYPVERALDEGGGSWSLEAGIYRLWSYPLSAPSRRTYGLEDLTAWEVRQAANQPSLWNQTIQATWNETPERRPHEYKLDSPAPVKAQVIVDESMVWEAIGPDGSLLERSPGGAPRELTLPQGQTRFLLRAKSLDNQRDYSFRVSTRDLTPGRSIVLETQVPVPLAVGTAGTYELATWGNQEVGLSLFDETGRKLIARATPRTDDWNVALTVPLTPGRYLVYAGSAAESAPEPQENAYEEEYYEDEYSEDEYEEEDYETPPQPDRPPQPWTAWTEARFPGDQGQAPLLIFQARNEVSAPSATSGRDEVWGSNISVRSFTTGEAGVYRFTSDAGRLAEFRLEKEGETLAQAQGGFLIPLPAKTTYRLAIWWEVGTDRPVSWSGSLAPEVRPWKSPDRTSGRILGVPSLWASPDWESPLVPAPDGWMAPRDSTVWWTSEGEVPSSLTPLSPTLSTGGSLSVPLGNEGQSVGIEVPVGSVGLLTARGAGEKVGLSVQAPGPLANEWNWNQALMTRLASVVGVGPGKANARVWSPTSLDEPRWVDLTWSVFPAEPLPAGTLQGSVEPGKAVLVKAGAKTLRFLLGEGMVAFALDGVGNRPVAGEGPSTGLLSGSLWAVVNPSRAAQPWRALVATSPSTAVVTDTQPFERRLEANEDLILEVKGSPGSRVRVSFEDADEVLWADAQTGHWGEAETESGPAGSRLFFRAEKGTLFLSGVRGWLRVWTASDGKADTIALGLEGGSRPTLPAEGAVLTPGAQGWTFTPSKAGFYSFEADGSGVLAVTAKDGRVLASSWSTDRRSVLVRLGTEAVLVGARPFAGSAQFGTLRLQPLDPQPTGNPLLGPGERHLWPVVVAAPGRVGLGVESSVEGLTLRLFRPDFAPLAAGPLFWRVLAPGTYWLVVEGIDRPLRYRPILLGLEGSRLGVPDEVRSTFEQGSEQ